MEQKVTPQRKIEIESLYLKNDGLDEIKEEDLSSLLRSNDNENQENGRLSPNIKIVETCSIMNSPDRGSSSPRSRRKKSEELRKSFMALKSQSIESNQYWDQIELLHQHMKVEEPKMIVA